jgi:hypothetical protein
MTYQLISLTSPTRRFATAAGHPAPASRKKKRIDNYCSDICFCKSLT